MKGKLEYVWPAVGLAAVVFSCWLLWRELHAVSMADIKASLAAIRPHEYMLAGFSTLVAYAALAWYDRIALMHVGKVLSLAIVSVVSFVAYAVGHNIGVSVLSSMAPGGIEVNCPRN